MCNFFRYKGLLESRFHKRGSSEKARPRILQVPVLSTYKVLIRYTRFYGFNVAPALFKAAINAVS